MANQIDLSLGGLKPLIDVVDKLQASLVSVEKAVNKLDQTSTFKRVFGTSNEFENFVEQVNKISDIKADSFTGIVSSFASLTRAVSGFKKDSGTSIQSVFLDISNSVEFLAESAKKMSKDNPIEPVVKLMSEVRKSLSQLQYIGKNGISEGSTKNLLSEINSLIDGLSSVDESKLASLVGVGKALTPLKGFIDTLTTLSSGNINREKLKELGNALSDTVLIFLMNISEFANSFIIDKAALEFIAGNITIFATSIKAITKSFLSLNDINKDLPRLAATVLVLPVVFTVIGALMKVITYMQQIGKVSSLLSGNILGALGTEQALENMVLSIRRMAEAFGQISRTFTNKAGDFNVSAVFKIGLVFPMLMAQLAGVMKAIGTFVSIPIGNDGIEIFSTNINLVGSAFTKIRDSLSASVDRGGPNGILATIAQVVKIGVIFPILATQLAVVLKSIGVIMAIPIGNEGLDRFSQAIDLIGRSFKNITMSLGFQTEFNAVSLIKTVANIVVIGGIFPSLVGVLATTMKGISLITAIPIGKDSFDKFAESIKNLANGFSTIVNAFSAKNKDATFGILSTLGSIIKIGVIFPTLVGWLVTIFKGLSLLNSIGDSGRLSTSKLADTFESITKSFKIMSSIGGKEVSISNTFKAMKPLFDSLRQFGSFKKFDFGGVGEMFTGVSTLATSLNRATFNEEKVAVIKNLVISLQSVIPMFGKIKVSKQTADAIKSVASIFDTLTTAASKGKNLDIGGIGNFLKELGNLKNINIGATKATLGAIRDTLADFANINVNSDKADAINKLASALKNSAEGIAKLSHVSGASAGTNFVASFANKFSSNDILDQIARGFFHSIGGKLLELPSLVVNSISNALTSVGTFFYDIGQKITDLKQKLTAFGDSAYNFGTNLFNHIKTFVSGLDEAIGFNKLATQLKVFGNLTDQELVKAEKFANVIGIKYPMSANDAMAAMLALLKTGQKLADIEFILPSAADLTSLSDSQDMKLITETLIAAESAFTEFGKGDFGVSIPGTFKNISVAADILAGIADVTTASVDSLSQGLSNVGASASLFGLNFAETTAVLGVFDQNAIKAAEGGTALRSLLNSMSSKKFKDGIKAIGGDFDAIMYDKNGNRRDFNDIVNDLQKLILFNSKGLRRSEKDINNILVSLADTYGRQGLAILLASGKNIIADTISAAEASGTAAEKAGLLLDNFSGNFLQLQGSFDTFKTRVLLPFLERFLNPMVSIGRLVIDTLLSMPQAFFDVTGSAIGFATALATIVATSAVGVGGLIKFGNVLFSIAQYIVMFGSNLALTYSSIAGFAALTATTVATLAAMGVLLATAGAGLQFIYDIFKNNSGGATDSAKELFNSLSHLFSTIKSVGSSTLNILSALFYDLGNNMSSSVGSNISTVFNSITKFVDRMSTKAGNIKIIISGLLNFIKLIRTDFAIGDLTKSIFGGGKDNALTSVKEGKDAIQREIHKMRIRLEAELGGVADAFNNLFGTNIDNEQVKNIFNSFVDTFIYIKDNLKTVVTSGGDLLLSLFGLNKESEEMSRIKIRNAIGGILSKVVVGLDKLFGFDVKSVIANTFKRGDIEGGFSLAGKRIVSIVKRWVDKNKSFFVNAIAGVFNVFILPFGRIRSIMSLLGIDFLNPLFNQIDTTLRYFIDQFIDLFTGRRDFNSILQEWITNIKGFLNIGLNSLVSSITSFILSIPPLVADFIRKIPDAIIGFGKSIGSTFLEKIGEDLKLGDFAQAIRDIAVEIGNLLGRALTTLGQLLVSGGIVLDQKWMVNFGKALLSGNALTQESIMNLADGIAGFISSALGLVPSALEKLGIILNIDFLKDATSTIEHLASLPSQGLESIAKAINSIGGALDETATSEKTNNFKVITDSIGDIAVLPINALGSLSGFIETISKVNSTQGAIKLAILGGGLASIAAAFVTFSGIGITGLRVLLSELGDSVGGFLSKFTKGKLGGLIAFIVYFTLFKNVVDGLSSWVSGKSNFSESLTSALGGFIEDIGGMVLGLFGIDTIFGMPVSDIKKNFTDAVNTLSFMLKGTVSNMFDEVSSAITDARARIDIALGALGTGTGVKYFEIQTKVSAILTGEVTPEEAANFIKKMILDGLDPEIVKSALKDDNLKKLLTDFFITSLNGVEITPESLADSAFILGLGNAFDNLILILAQQGRGPELLKAMLGLTPAQLATISFEDIRDDLVTFGLKYGWNPADILKLAGKMGLSPENIAQLKSDLERQFGVDLSGVEITIYPPSAIVVRGELEIRSDIGEARNNKEALNNELRLILATSLGVNEDSIESFVQNSDGSYEVRLKSGGTSVIIPSDIEMIADFAYGDSESSSAKDAMSKYLSTLYPNSTVTTKPDGTFEIHTKDGEVKIVTPFTFSLTTVDRVVDTQTKLDIVNAAIDNLEKELQAIIDSGSAGSITIKPSTKVNLGSGTITVNADGTTSFVINAPLELNPTEVKVTNTQQGGDMAIPMESGSTLTVSVPDVALSPETQQLVEDAVTDAVTGAEVDTQKIVDFVTELDPEKVSDYLVNIDLLKTDLIEVGTEYVNTTTSVTAFDDSINHLATYGGTTLGVFMSVMKTDLGKIYERLISINNEIDDLQMSVVFSSVTLPPLLTIITNSFRTFGISSSNALDPLVGKLRTASDLLMLLLVNMEKAGLVPKGTVTDSGNPEKKRYGGPVVAGNLYEVAESGMSELLRMGNKTYLIPGANGTIIPSSGAAPLYKNPTSNSYSNVYNSSNSSESFGDINVTIQGGSNMSPQDISRAVRDGVDNARRASLNKRMALGGVR